MKVYRLKINGNDYEVEINSVEGEEASLTVNGTPYRVKIDGGNESASEQAIIDAPVRKINSVSSQSRPVMKKPTDRNDIKSPLPGIILTVRVKVGDVVSEGQEVAVLEAMKMENTIEATHGGKVVAVHVSEGESVLEGAALVTIV